jgi:biotin operon repressor
MKVGQFKFLPNAAEAIKAFRQKGYYVFVVTNQPGAAKGKTDLATLYDINTYMIDALAKAGADIDENKEYYTLLLDCPERDLHLSAEIGVTWEIHGLLRKRHYSLIRSEKLAADHPLLIADALLYLYDLAE